MVHEQIHASWHSRECMYGSQCMRLAWKLEIGSCIGKTEMQNQWHVWEWRNAWTRRTCPAALPVANNTVPCDAQIVRLQALPGTLGRTVVMNTRVLLASTSRLVELSLASSAATMSHPAHAWAEVNHSWRNCKDTRLAACAFLACCQH